MEVDFYYDPSCPFCWITSRWLLEVSGHRDLTIDWRPFSLALKNGELQDDNDSGHGESHRQAHRVLRVIHAAQKEHDVTQIDLYTAFGRQRHVADREYDDELITEILEELDLPEILLAEADNADHDADLQDSMESALAVAGDDIGVPVIVFTADGDQKNGFFGPVLQSLPAQTEDSLRLWDGLSQLATDSNFYELKRSRPSGGPDTYSTARC